MTYAPHSSIHFIPKVDMSGLGMGASFHDDRKTRRPRRKGVTSPSFAHVCLRRTAILGIHLIHSLRKQKRAVRIG